MKIYISDKDVGVGRQHPVCQRPLFGIILRKKTKVPKKKSPSMPLLVFWPHAGAWGAGVILPPCAQLLWFELYVMKSTQKKKKKKKSDDSTDQSSDSEM